MVSNTASRFRSSQKHCAWHTDQPRLPSTLNVECVLIRHLQRHGQYRCSASTSYFLGNSAATTSTTDKSSGLHSCTTENKSFNRSTVETIVIKQCWPHMLHRSRSTIISNASSCNANIEIDTEHHNSSSTQSSAVRQVAEQHCDDNAPQRQFE
jgi:hypothetical protein